MFLLMPLLVVAGATGTSAGTNVSSLTDIQGSIEYFTASVVLGCNLLANAGSSSDLCDKMIKALDLECRDHYHSWCNKIAPSLKKP